MRKLLSLLFAFALAITPAYPATRTKAPHTRRVRHTAKARTGKRVVRKPLRPAAKRGKRTNSLSKSKPRNLA